MNTIVNIMIAFVILHNIIIEDQKKHSLEALFEPKNIKKQFRHGLSFEQYKQGMDLEDVDAHLALRGDLIGHLLAQKAVDNMKFFFNHFLLLHCNLQHCSFQECLCL